MVILCHHPHGLGLQGDGREREGYEWSGVGGHRSRHSAAHKDAAGTRQKVNGAAFACCRNWRCLSLCLNALQKLRPCDGITANSGGVNQKELC